MKTRRSTKIIIYLFLLLYSITTLFPFLWMVAASFKTSGAIFEIPPKLIPDLLFKEGMWSNYIEVLTEHNFLKYLGNSLFISTVASLGQLLTCSLAAFAFARMEFKGKNIIFAVLIAMMMIPVEVTIIPEFLMFSSINWLNTYLPLIVPSLLVGSFGTFMLREFYQSIPSSLVDAAIMDGAKPFQIYRRIFLPLSKAPLATLFIIAFMNNWNDILRPVLYINSPEKRTVTLGLTEFQSLYSTDWNLLLTASVIAIIPMIIIFIVAQKYIIEGMVNSGIKG
ncbi:carbohydrate ABC transporter permease [Oceanobacillus chungangensis]|uniref:Sugar ABC transporter permease n=1 Tax=Oceanobacillus chungangensis TaxID=1229152 RepID=A0A3D8PJF0_9BACI|nr:carbohydrate ABC transporter permease [Oceanobacillus chungangensis]RDW15348.1 sugar ABC transporter permease [Oceanobacillus chungangensis]